MSVQNGAFTRSNGFTPEKDGIIPRFFIESVEDPLASQREGHPVFFDQERVELLVPGNMLNVVVEIVGPSHAQRWPEAYKRFKDGQEMATNGTPLEFWPILKPAQVRELKAMNLFTIEHVRDMNDQVAQRKMAGRKLRNFARAYLDDAAAGAMLSKATADNEAKDLRIGELEHKVNELSTLLDSVHRDMQTLRNAPNPIASHVPGMHDPMEALRQAEAPQGGSSSLDLLPDAPPPRRGRKQGEVVA